MVKASKNKKYGWIFWVVLIIAVYVWTILGMNLSGIQSSAVEVTKSIFNGICHPDWHYVYNGSGEDLVSLIIQTLAIEFLGTFVSAFLSVPFAFLAARSSKRSAQGLLPGC